MSRNQPSSQLILRITKFTVQSICLNKQTIDTNRRLNLDIHEFFITRYIWARLVGQIFSFQKKNK